MNYTTYLFDFDYTLADSSPGIVTCFQNVLKHHGYTETTDEAIKSTIGKTLEDSFSILTGVTDADQLAAFKKEYEKEADTHMTVNTVLFLETKSVLLALKDAGAFIGIISTKYRFRIKELLDQHFPGSFFNIIVGGEDVQAHKPSPEGLLFAIKQLHATKAETLYIGDSTVDAATAKAAGVNFAGITHGVTTAEELSKYPHWKIMSSLEELLESDQQSNTDEKPSPHPVASPSPKPKPTSPTPSGRKRINIWQILLLAFLLWFSYEEGYEEGSNSSVFLFSFILVLWNILRKRRILPKRVIAFISPWWNPCKIRLRAFHIKMIRGKQTPPISEESNICLNCGNVYTGSYCNRCGQSRNTSRYRLSNALKNIIGGFTNIDSGFGRTIIDLLCRPGYMIRDFIAGKRIKYFRPFQTLFILAALYIMAVQLVDPNALKKKDKSPEAQKQETIDKRDHLQKKMEESGNPQKKKTLALTIEKLNESLKEQETDNTSEILNSVAKTDNVGIVNDYIQVKQALSKNVEETIKNVPFLQKVWDLLKSWGHGNKAFHIIAKLPLLALTTFLAFYRRRSKPRYNLTEHLFVQAYIACQMLLVSIIVLPFNGSARVDDLYEAPLWCIFALFCLDYKQLYGCTWWKSFWTTVVIIFYSLALILLIAILAVALMVAVVHVAKPFLS